MTVTITVPILSTTLITDSLMMDVSHNLQTQAFQVQAIQTPPARVIPELPDGVIIAVLPNPVSNIIFVDLKGIGSAGIQIFDLLGKEIVSGNSSSVWKDDLTSLPGGTYIIRISGESSRGENFTTSKRIILRK